MEELKNIKVALLGSGTVGTGVYKLIERQREELPHKVGAGLTVSKVLVRDKNKKREGIDPSVLTDQWEDIITDGSYGGNRTRPYLYYRSSSGR